MAPSSEKPAPAADPHASSPADSLGAYLKDRRMRLDPAALGFPMTRRRTPGLRREEVAQRAHVSATWYTWLEQGRGGAPSADVLDRLSRALMLTEVEREHIFLLALGRPPEIRSRPEEGVTPRLQRVLDALELSPALVRTATWTVVAWNKAATAVLTDYSARPSEERNVLRLMFFNKQTRAAQVDWEATARFVVATFRAEIARAGMAGEAQALIDEMRQRSPEFDAMWRDRDVRTHGEGTKRLRHPIAGLLTFEYSSFAVDGRPDLGMSVYSPATEKDAARVRTLIAAREMARETPKEKPGSGKR